MPDVQNGKIITAAASAGAVFGMWALRPWTGPSLAVIVGGGLAAYATTRENAVGDVAHFCAETTIKLTSKCGRLIEEWHLAERFGKLLHVVGIKAVQGGDCAWQQVKRLTQTEDVRCEPEEEESPRLRRSMDLAPRKSRKSTME